ncbi:putative uncharacterized protein DDB_G0282133 [Hydra vulgaris]|uniref:putative uncharacterized protein DDB_G0282133 n=1 Tax=Hydra vulgaris TaxID=6087 RepID=UPI001F5F8439|nr:putative uncharacterized protein DDB_G0282133 [Hydra vulgaris]
MIFFHSFCLLFFFADATVFIAEHEKEPIFVPDTGNTWFTGYHKQDILPHVVEQVPIGKPFIPDKHSIYKIYDKNVEDGPLNDYFENAKLDYQTSHKKSPEPLDKKENFLEDSLYGVRLTGDISGLSSDDLPSIMKGTDSLRDGSSKTEKIENNPSVSHIHLLESDPTNSNFESMVFRGATNGATQHTVSFSPPELSSSYITAKNIEGTGQNILNEAKNNREIEKSISSNSVAMPTASLFAGQNDQTNQASFSLMDDSQYHVEGNPSEIYPPNENIQVASQNTEYQINSQPVTSVSHSLAVPSVINAHDLVEEIKDDGQSNTENQHSMNAIHIYAKNDKSDSNSIVVLPKPSPIKLLLNDPLENSKEVQMNDNKIDEPTSLPNSQFLKPSEITIQNTVNLKTTTQPLLKPISKSNLKHHRHQITIDTDTGEVVREETSDEEESKQNTVVNVLSEKTQPENITDQLEAIPSLSLNIGKQQKGEKLQELKLKKVGNKENLNEHLLTLGHKNNQNEHLVIASSEKKQNKHLLVTSSNGNLNKHLLSTNSKGNQKERLITTSDKGNQNEDFITMGRKGNHKIGNQEKTTVDSIESVKNLNDDENTQSEVENSSDKEEKVQNIEEKAIFEEEKTQNEDENAANNKEKTQNHDGEIFQIPNHLFNKFDSHKNFKLHHRNKHTLFHTPLTPVKTSNKKLTKIIQSTNRKLKNTSNNYDDKDNENSENTSEDAISNNSNLEENNDKNGFGNLLHFPSFKSKLRYAPLIKSIHPFSPDNNKYVDLFKPQFKLHKKIKNQEHSYTDKHYMNADSENDSDTDLNYDKDEENEDNDDNVEDLPNENLITKPSKALSIIEGSIKQSKFAHRRHETNINSNEHKNTNNEKKDFYPDKHVPKFNTHIGMDHNTEEKEYEVESDNDRTDQKEYHLHNHVHNEQHIHIHKGSGEKGGFRYLRLHKVGSSDHELLKSPQTPNKAENSASFSDGDSKNEDEKSDEDSDREALELLKNYAKSRDNHFNEKGLFNISSSADDYKRNHYGNPDKESIYSGDPSQRSELNLEKISKSQNKFHKTNDTLDEEENNPIDDPAFSYSKMVDQVRYQSLKPQHFLPPVDDSDHLHVDETETNKFEDNDFSSIKKSKKHHRLYFEPKIKKAKEVVEPTYMIHGDPHGDGFGSAVIDGPAELGSSVPSTESAKSTINNAGTTVPHLHEETPKGMDGSKRDIPSTIKKVSNISLNENIKNNLSYVDSVPKNNLTEERKSVEHQVSEDNKNEKATVLFKSQNVSFDHKLETKTSDLKVKEKTSDDEKVKENLYKNFDKIDKNIDNEKNIDKNINFDFNKNPEDKFDKNIERQKDNNNIKSNQSETETDDLKTSKKLFNDKSDVLNRKEANEDVAIDKTTLKPANSTDIEEIKKNKKKERSDSEKSKEESKDKLDSHTKEQQYVKKDPKLVKTTIKNIKSDHANKGMDREEPMTNRTNIINDRVEKINEKTEQQQFPEISSQNNESTTLSLKAQTWLNEISNEQNFKSITADSPKDAITIEDHVNHLSAQPTANEKDDSKLMKLVQLHLKKNTTLLRSGALKQLAHDIFSPATLTGKHNYTIKNKTKEIPKIVKTTIEVERYNPLHLADERNMFKEVHTSTLSNLKDGLMSVDLDGMKSLDSKIKSMNFQLNNIEESNFAKKLKLDLDTKSTNFVIPDHQETLPLLNPGHPDDINGVDKKSKNLKAKFNILLNPAPTIGMSKSNSRLIPQPYQVERGYDKSFIFRHPVPRKAQVTRGNIRDQAMKIKGNENDLQLQPFFIASHLKKYNRSTKNSSNHRSINFKDGLFGLRYFIKNVSAIIDETLPVKFGRQKNFNA